MEVVRIGRECLPSNVWTTDAENGTLWHGHSSYILNELRNKLPPLKFVSQLSPSNWSYAAVHSILDDVIDLDPDTYALIWDRFQYVDYSYPIQHGKYYIISGELISISGQVLDGVFDGMSYALFGLALLCFTLLLTFGNPEQNEPSKWKWISSFVVNLIAALGMMITPCSYSISKNNKITDFLARFCSFLLYVFYNSVIISKLLAPLNLDSIDTLEDLVKADVKILVLKTSGQMKFLQNSAFYNEMEDKMETPDLMEYLQNWKTYSREISSRKMVVLEAKHNIVELNKYIPEKVRCDIIQNQQFYYSQPMFESNVAWIFKKQFKYQEVIDLTLLRLESYGILM